MSKLKLLVVLIFLLPHFLLGAEGNFCHLSFVSETSLDGTLSNSKYLKRLVSETNTENLLMFGRDFKKYDKKITKFRQRVSKVKSEDELVLAAFHFLVETRNFKVNQTPAKLSWKKDHIVSLSKSIKNTVYSNELNVIEKTYISSRKLVVGLLTWTYRYSPKELKSMEASLWELKRQLEQEYSVNLESYSKKRRVLGFLNKTVFGLIKFITTLDMNLHTSSSVFIPNKLYSISVHSIVSHSQWYLRISYIAGALALAFNPGVVFDFIDAVKNIDTKKIVQVSQKVGELSSETLNTNGENLRMNIAKDYLNLLEIQKKRQLTAEELSTLSTYEWYFPDGVPQT